MREGTSNKDHGEALRKWRRAPGKPDCGDKNTSYRQPEGNLSHQARRTVVNFRVFRRHFFTPSAMSQHGISTAVFLRLNFSAFGPTLPTWALQ
jgi:hypothetical protein